MTGSDVKIKRTGPQGDLLGTRLSPSCDNIFETLPVITSVYGWGHLTEVFPILPATAGQRSMIESVAPVKS